ncbi:MAG: ATP-grasp domain-containing protein [Planctomycetes bacterium]|nr:ATP-grasp domain-containing protein [Planctomycetota bacterium]
MLDLPPPGSPQEIARFKELSALLEQRFEAFRADAKQPYTAVVVPSQSVDPVELAKIKGVQHYEERSLFNLMLLRMPRLRVIYVTSKPLNPLVVDYFLHQLRAVPSEHAQRRLTLLDCDDASPRPLTQKILERPRLIQRLRDSIEDPAKAHMVVFNSTALERTLSVQLGIPLHACDPDLAHLGGKTGAREVFHRAGILVSPGREGLRDAEDLAQGIADLSAEAPDLRRVVVKLNESFSGEGNAILDLTPLRPRPGAAIPVNVVREALPGLAFEAEGLGWEGYRAQFDDMGGICEGWLEGEKASPSVQMRVNPAREVQVISTHDQVLGGRSGQVFMGATFPAAPEVRLDLQRLGRRVGDELVKEGVIGRFGVDFVTVKQPDGPPKIYALEINLRQGGTTHPFNTLKFITDGRFDEESGQFFTAQGHPRCYFATDYLAAPEFRGILPFDLLDRLVVEGIHFRANDTGVVFHLLGCLSEFGKLGCTAIAETIPEALQLHQETVRLLHQLGGRAQTP